VEDIFRSLQKSSEGSGDPEDNDVEDIEEVEEVK